MGQSVTKPNYYSMILICVLLTGCADYPLRSWTQEGNKSTASSSSANDQAASPQIPAPPKPQPLAPEGTLSQLVAPADWKALAQKISDNASEVAEHSEWIEQRSLYLSTPQKPTLFSHALQNFLLTALQQKGLPVSQLRDKSAVVDFDIQTLPVNGKLEMIVTTTITDAGKYLFRKSDIFLIQEADVRLYEESLVPPPPPEIYPMKVLKVQGN